jgi:hypothetical protein
MNHANHQELSEFRFNIESHKVLLDKVCLIQAL